MQFSHKFLDVTCRIISDKSSLLDEIFVHKNNHVNTSQMLFAVRQQPLKQGKKRRDLKNENIFIKKKLLITLVICIYYQKYDSTSLIKDGAGLHVKWLPIHTI